MSHTPTDEIYEKLEHAFNHFNKALFDDTLPKCLLTVQREKNTMGYFSPVRWQNKAGVKTHEIAVNPLFFAKYPLIEMFQTIVHEQVHLWQYEFGKPSRKTYHNKEWAMKMESIGLMPSDTGQPGGKKTGQKVSDYPIPGGLFEKTCIALMESGYYFDWVDRWGLLKETPISNFINQVEQSNTEALDTEKNVSSFLQLLHQPVKESFGQDELATAVPGPAQNNSKTKYSCVGCGINVWGKPNLQIMCMSCNIQIYEQ